MKEEGGGRGKSCSEICRGRVLDRKKGQQCSEEVDMVVLGLNGKDQGEWEEETYEAENE